MPNKPTPTDPVEIEFEDGRVCHLRYTAASARTIKKIFGKSIFRGELPDFDEDSLPTLIAIGTVEKLNGDEVAEVMDLRNMPYYCGCFIAALQGSMPEPKDNVVPINASQTAS